MLSLKEMGISTDYKNLKGNYNHKCGKINLRGVPLFKNK
jgi:hypothetical protein